MEARRRRGRRGERAVRWGTEEEERVVYAKRHGIGLQKENAECREMRAITLKKERVELG